MEKPNEVFKLKSLDDDNILFIAENQEQITRKTDQLLTAFKKCSLMEKLNEMQLKTLCCGNCEKNILSSKFTMPLYFVNLIIYPYNVKIVFESE